MGIANQERNKYEPYYLVGLFTTIMTSTELTEIYGRSIKPDEFAKFLGIDRRTVVKYAPRWGGVEVSPGKWRFFEKRIMEVLNAEFDKETGDIAISWKCNGQGGSKSKTVSGCVNEIKAGSNRLGKRRKRRNGKGTIPDKFGIFDDC
ncbi:MAG: hypothetical protein KAS04_06315 [Candidatus Aenigmarchaeota archaeon]|nr:hypothetical protein [Candidatus Aenigmarchaeota archaeon]